MAGNRFKWTSDTLTPGMAIFQVKLHAAVTAWMEFMSDKCEVAMKKNAPWTDQTSNARNSLSTSAFSSPDEYTIVLYHQMPYGIWLEVRWEGKYAIILPTIDSMGTEVMLGLTSIIGRLGG